MTGPVKGTENEKPQTDTMTEDSKEDNKITVTDNDTMDGVYAPSISPQDFEHGPWLDPADETYGRGRRCQAAVELIALANGKANLKEVETVLVTLAEDEPEIYKEAMTSPDAEKWKSTCTKEYNTLMGYHTWTLVERPPNTNIVGSHWTFQVKHDNHGQVNRYKAQLIAQGFSKVPSLDFNETYAPTIQLTTICFIIALAGKYNLELQQIDVKGAYLNGKLDKDVYMRQPEGFIEPGKERLVCKLLKGVYGLKQSGRVWHHLLKTKLKNIRFKAGEADMTVYFRCSQGGSIEIAGWYVDDGLLATNSTQVMDKMVNDIRGSFDIQDLGEPDQLLGIRISRNRDIGITHLLQPSFILTIAKHFNISAG